MSDDVGEAGGEVGVLDPHQAHSTAKWHLRPLPRLTYITQFTGQPHNKLRLAAHAKYLSRDKNDRPVMKRANYL